MKHRVCATSLPGDQRKGGYQKDTNLAGKEAMGSEGGCGGDGETSGMCRLDGEQWNKKRRGAAVWGTSGEHHHGAPPRRFRWWSDVARLKGLTKKGSVLSQQCSHVGDTAREIDGDRCPPCGSRTHQKTLWGELGGRAIGGPHTRQGG